MSVGVRGVGGRREEHSVDDRNGVENGHDGSIGRTQQHDCRLSFPFLSFPFVLCSPTRVADFEPPHTVPMHIHMPKQHHCPQ